MSQIENPLKGLSVLHLQSLFEIPTKLQTIELSGLTRRRSSFVKSQLAEHEGVTPSFSARSAEHPVSPIA